MGMKYIDYGKTHISPAVQQLLDTIVEGLDEQALRMLLQAQEGEEIFWRIDAPECRLGNPKHGLGSILLIIEPEEGRSIYAPLLQFKIPAPHGRFFGWNTINRPVPGEPEHGEEHHWVRLEEYAPGVFRQNVEFR